ncbi:hypothetical protein [Streptomyces sp. CL7]|uniref:hypothetical protein n=1 Tax=Streptomyces sp. CL7 TaxID=3096006 RepID=UPI002A74E381|nr:hypothetical protein [Streptomyces sp. CL7]WPP31482.1 hypothetical protein SJH97_20120 [Streptomyces sp. CL7]
MNATGTWRLADVSPGDFLDGRGAEVDALPAGDRSACAFDSTTMSIAWDLGRLRPHHVTAASLLLWSGGLTGVPDDPAELESSGSGPAHVAGRRGPPAHAPAARVGDRGGGRHGGGAGRGARVLAAVLTAACALSGGPRPSDVLRLWPVAHLVHVLRPGSDASDAGRSALRANEHVLTATFDDD